MRELIFEWDNDKAAKVLNERNIDFKDMVQIFTGQMVEYVSDKNGEYRIIAIGKLNNRFYSVVYTKRGDVIRLITARRAWKSEERKYYQSYF